MNVSNLTMGGGKRHSQVLDLLRFPLAVVIVIVHVFNGGSSIVIHGVEYSFKEMPFFLSVMEFVKAFFAGQSVPVYFFISGYVFFFNIGDSFSKGIYIKKLKNRIKTLFVPYVLWNLIAALLFVSYYYPPLSYFFPGFNVSDLEISLRTIFNVFWDVTQTPFWKNEVTEGFNWCTFPVDGPLWFVRDLMFLTLLSPVIYFLIRKKVGLYVVLLFGILWFYGTCTGILIGNEYGIVKRVFIGLFYFSLGAYFSIHKMDMVYQFGKYSNLSFLIYPLLGILYMVLSYVPMSLSVLSVVKPVNVFVGLFFAYNLAALIVKKGIFRPSGFLVSSSFFIYVSHWLIKDNVLKGLLLLLKPSSDFGVLGVYLLTVFVVIMVLLGVYWFMRRFTPRLLGVLVGRRA